MAYGTIIRVPKRDVSGGIDKLRRSAYQVRPQGRTYECYQRRLRGMPTAIQPPGTGIILKLSSSS
jgi:hypothetical protein